MNDRLLRGATVCRDQIAIKDAGELIQSLEVGRSISRTEARRLLPPEALADLGRGAIFSLDKGGRVWAEPAEPTDPITWHEGRWMDEYELRQLLEPQDPETV